MPYQSQVEARRGGCPKVYLGSEKGVRIGTVYSIVGDMLLRELSISYGGSHHSVAAQVIFRE